MSVFIVVLAFVAGVIIKNRVKNSWQWLLIVNHWVIFVALPAMIFLSIRTISWSDIAGFSVIAAWCSQLFCMLLVLITAALLKWRADLTGAMLIVAVLGNTAFLGYPVVIACWGHAALPFAVLYDQFGTFLALSLYVPVIIALFGTGKHNLSLVAIGKKIVLFPPFIALLLGLLVDAENVPIGIVQMLALLAKTLVPLSILAIGLQFTLRLNDTADRTAIIVGLCIKMLVSPLIVMTSALFIGQSLMAFNVTVMQSAMPPMITAAMLAMSSGLAPRVVAPMVSFGVLLAFITLPVLYFVLV